MINDLSFKKHKINFNTYPIIFKYLNFFLKKKNDNIDMTKLKKFN